MFRRLNWVLWLPLCLTLLALPACNGQPIHLQLPEDAKRLLPETSVVLVVLESVSAADHLWNTLATTDRDTPEETPVLDLMNEQLPDFASLADLTKPVLMIVAPAAPMSGESEIMTLIFPVVAEDLDPAPLLAESRFASYKRQGTYLALSTIEAYEPAAEIPQWANTLPANIITAQADLVTLIQTFRPMAEMVMGMMAISATVEQPTAVEGQPAQPTMTPDQAEALVNLLRAMLDSGRLLELSLGNDDNQLLYSQKIGVLEGSPFAPGPQPALQTALDMTRLLPGTEDLLVAGNLDMSSIMDIMMPYYETMIAPPPSMSPDQAQLYTQWMEQYWTLMPLANNPLVISLDMGQEHFTALKIIQVANADQQVQAIAQLMNSLTEAGLGVTLVQTETPTFSDIPIHSWQIEIDAEALAALAPAAPPMGVPTEAASSKEDALVMAKLISKIASNVYMCAWNNHVIISADNTVDRLHEVLTRANNGDGHVDPGLAEIADRVGPECQVAMNGNLRSVVGMIAELMEEMAQDGTSVPWPTEGAPLPFSGAVSVVGNDYIETLEVDVAVVQEIVRLVQSMED